MPARSSTPSPTRSGTAPTSLGKPAHGFFEQALDGLGTPAAETAMIGDDIAGDIGAAQAAGLAGIQVRTGKFRPADLDGNIEPTAVIDSIADLPGWWER
ncbi:MAG: HAD hydrolase-like protein [Halofilum sp. (in: g-proteobacteria)]|nr:HAD hydrolase-like protein [Halofilum sp. (in: g-proteobacteria)]